MVMSSGKSNSMAAVLLLLVVVAGTCASSAQAFFNIYDACDEPITLGTNTTKKNLVVYPHKSLYVDVPLKEIFTSPVTFTLLRRPNPRFRIPQTAVDRLNQSGKDVLFIEIKCEGFCFTLVVAYYPGLKQYVLGPFCP